MLYSLLLPIVSVMPLWHGAGAGVQKQVPAHGVTVGTTNTAGGGGLQPGAPWPKFRQNNQGTGQSPWGGSNMTIRWLFDCGSPIFLSSPAVAADGTIYFGAENGQLFAVSGTGSLKWSFQTNGPIWSSPAIGSDGTIYVGSDDSSLYAINPSGTKKWSYATGDQVISSPAIGGDGTVYFGSYDGNVYAVNSTGSLKWKYITGGPVESSPSLGSDGTVYIGSNDYNLYAITSAGKLSWTFPMKGPIYSSPTVGPDGTIYAASASPLTDIYAISPDGAKKWEVDAASSFGPPTRGPITASPALANGGLLYLPVNSLLELTALGSLVSNSNGGYSDSAAIGSDGTVYVSNIGDFLGNGVSYDELLSSPAIGVDGTVYLCADDGYIIAYGTQVNTVAVSSLSLAPATLPGGSSSTGTVTLVSTPPAGGDVVTLTSSNPAVASLISPATVNSGQTSATFAIRTVPVTADTAVTITATSGGVTKTTILTVKAPVPSTLTVSPSTVTGSAGTVVTGTVTLSGAAPPGGVTVTLTSSNSAAASVPSSVSIPAGSYSASFTVSHFKVSSQTIVTLTGTLNGVSASGNLTVNAG